MGLPGAQTAKCIISQNPSEESALWGFANFDSPRRVPKQDSQVLLLQSQGSLPWEAANLNWVHECQQVPWREEGRGDIGAAGGSIYSCFLKNPV